MTRKQRGNKEKKKHDKMEDVGTHNYGRSKGCSSKKKKYKTKAERQIDY